jgi:hypothetical protein
MELIDTICPICHRNLPEHLSSEDHGNIIHVKCDYCGRYTINGHQIIGILHVKQNMPNNAHVSDLDMSIALRHLSLGSKNPIEVTAKNYNEIKESIRIPADPLEVLDFLIEYCGLKATRFNVGICIPFVDIPLLYIHDINELEAILVMAMEMDYIGQYHSDRGCYAFSLQVKGWERIVLLRKVRSESKKVFIAMKFGDPELDKVFLDAIVPAVEMCGYHTLRIDREHHNDKICDKVIAEIKQSAFVIADFTGHRCGVYFEAGYALGLGKPVIWCCRDNHFKKLHFDTRQYNHIKWSDPALFKEQLIDRIQATIIKSSI